MSDDKKKPMNIDLELAKLQQSTDQYRSVLREALLRLGIARSMEIISEVEKEFHAAEEPGEKLYCHAALVGLTVTLFDYMQAELEHAKSEPQGGGD